MAHDCQIGKDFLNYLDDFTTQDSFIGLTISTRSKKHESSVSNVSSPSVLSEDTEIFKTSAKPNVYDFYSKHLNHALMPNPDFEGYRNDIKTL
jgi:predicted metalloendopeptidase